MRFDLTYEGLKHEYARLHGEIIYCFDLTYEGLKLLTQLQDQLQDQEF